MADLGDKAQELQELHLQQSLQSRKPEAPRTGECLYCEAPIPTTHRFCDSECREAYEEEQTRQKRING